MRRYWLFTQEATKTECEQKGRVLTIQLSLHKTLQLPFYWEGVAHLLRFWTLVSLVYCGDCKMFFPLSHGRPVNNNNNSNNYYYYYLLQLGCYPVAVVILHVYKT